MNKRITSLLLCLIMIFSMLVTAVPVYAASTQLKITADKADAKPGDTITFTITLGPVENMGTMQMVTRIPAGLTYVAGSGTLAANLKATLGFDDVAWTHEAERAEDPNPGNMLSGVASAGDYSSTGDTVLATFQCTVDAGYSGIAEVTLYYLEFYSCESWEDYTADYTVVPAIINVEAVHVHNPTVVAAKAAGCETTGNIAYYECECGKYFEDAEATKEITDKESVVIPATDHDWDEGVVTTEPTETEKGEKTFTCKNDNSHTKTEAVPELGHQCKLHLTEVAAKAAGCETTGNIAYYECECGKYFEDAEATKEITDKESVVIPATDHDWDEGVVTTDPTETEKGEKTFTCKNDNSHTKTEEVPELGHQCKLHLTEVAAKAAGCETTGNIAYYECECGKYYEDAEATKEITDKDSVVIPATDHDWDEGVVTTDPTETEKGEKTFTCKNDNSHTKTEEVPELGHQCKLHLTEVAAKAAGCETTGNIAYYECECGKYYEDAEATKEITDKDSVVIPATDHDWDEGVVTTDPTETEKGEKTFTCKNDNSHTKTEEVPELGHQCKLHLTEVAAKAAGCETTGNTAYYECECGKYYEDAEATKEITDKESVVIPATDHDWDEGVVTTEPTETEKGEKTFTCKNDNSHTKTEAVPELGHQCKLHLTEVAAKAAGCETTGNIAYYECECGKYYEDAEATKEITDKDSVVIPATDHDWDEGVVTTEPTETEKGEKTFTCKNDNSHTKTEEVPELGHQCKLHLTEVAAKAAGCETTGNTAYYECECGKYYEDAEATKEITDKESVVIPATDHDWDEGVVTTEPTETEKGEKTFTCKNDNSHTKTEEVPELGHQCKLHLTAVAAKEADCKNAGNTAYYECECGKYYKDDAAVNEITDKKSVVIAAGHVWGEWTVTVEPTSKDKGEKQRVCSRCGETEEEEIPALKQDNSFMEEWFWLMVWLRNQEFKITADANEGGEITPEGVTKVRYDYEVKYTITPAAGYEIEAVYVDGVNIGAVTQYTFKRVNADHSIRVVFKAAYSDVKATDWYYEDVMYVTENGLMNGVGGSKFSPNESTTRAMIVTILWRLEGEPKAASNGFSDVAGNQWYTEAIDWAAANGIVLGYGDGTFGPEDDITREQVMAILHRFAAYKGWDNSDDEAAELQHLCSEWAETDVLWAEDNGLLSGLGVNVTNMTVEADRAEIAAYFTRFCKKVAE